MTDRIGASVGRRSTNAPGDVRIVQSLLRRHVRWLAPYRIPEVNGVCDEVTIRAIETFQTRAAALLRADGVVTPTGYTLTALRRPVIAEPRHPIFDARQWRHEPGTLNDADFRAAAAALACEAAAIEAVARVETKREAWDDQGRPTILFERHYFSRLSRRQFDASHPDISNPNQGGYGRFSEQYPKLRRAAILDEQAALKSASWGAFQIMGANHVAAGYQTVDAFVSAMMRSERAHLQAFVSFILDDNRLLRAIRARNWTTFARIYNGPGYARNAYDTQMQREYERLTTPARRAR